MKIINYFSINAREIYIEVLAHVIHHQKEHHCLQSHVRRPYAYSAIQQAYSFTFDYLQDALFFMLYLHLSCDCFKRVRHKCSKATSQNTRCYDIE